MKLEIVTIRDSALNCYMRPVFVRALGEAIRSFQDEVNNPQGELAKHPSDYELHHIGSYDDQTGQLIDLHTNELLARAKDLVNAK